MKNRFQIGEMAAVNHTTVKTLRYYDQIGLFRPRFVDPNSGYRYYEAEQFERLNTIQYLKTMGLSLAEIKQHLDRRSITDFKQLLQKQEGAIDQQIQMLQAIKRRFKSRITDLEVAQSQPAINHPRLEYLPERRLVQLEQLIRTNDELEIALRNLENQSHLKAVIFIGGVGLTIDQQSLQRHQFDEYHSIFVLLDEDSKATTTVTTIPAGRYACIYHHGNHTESGSYYERLLAYIRVQNLRVAGAAIERTIIDQYISRDPKDYLTKIEIPIVD